MMIQRIFVFMFLIGTLGHTSYAQGTGSTRSWEFGPFIGPLLSNAIPAFEDMPVLTGIRANTTVSFIRPEILYAQGSSSTGKAQLAYLSLKHEIKLLDIEDFTPFFLTGLQILRYEPPTSTGNGFHLGFGFDFVINKQVQFRNDFIMGNGPGRYLMIFVGIQISPGGNTSGDKK